MATTLGNKIIHAVIAQATYDSLENKSADTLYFVTTSDGIKLYKGSTLVSNDGFKVLSSNPSDTTGMIEGVLYLAPNGKMYYKSGSTLGIAFDLVKEANLPAKNATGNDDKVATIAALYTAINNEIAAALSGTYRNSILAPVANITALKAVTGMQDKDVIFVESLNALFSYDAESTATDNSTYAGEGSSSLSGSTDDDAVPTVVAPTSGTGRWLRTQSQFNYNSTDFTWTPNGGLTLNAARVAGILSDAAATAQGKVDAHNADSNTTAHAALFSAKLDKPTANGSDGQYLVWDATTSKPVWTTLPNFVKYVATKPAANTITTDNNGEWYYCLDEHQVYEVVAGELVQKTYSKANADTAISTAVSNHNADSNTTAHAALFAAKADNDDIKWNVIA